MIRREWNAADADNWTKEDWIAIVLSPLSYIFFAIGTAWALFLKPIGFLFLFLGAVCAGLMYYVIDPKLRALSSEYESNQKKYLAELDKKMKWSDDG